MNEEVPNMDEMLPPPAFYEAAMKRFDRQKYMEEKKNQPVSQFLQEFIMKLERSGGRLDGGLLVPQLDIFLQVKGKEKEGFKSLYKIYHTLEFCDKHGPKIPFEWDWSLVRSPLPLAVKNEEIKDDSEVDSGLGLFGDEESEKSSKGSIEDVNGNIESPAEEDFGKSRKSWVDWAVATFGFNENAKMTVLDEVSTKGEVLPPPKDAVVNPNTGSLWDEVVRKLLRKSPAQRQRFGRRTRK